MLCSNNIIDETKQLLQKARAETSPNMMDMERLLIALKPLKRWPPVGRTLTITPSTLPNLLQKLYTDVIAVDQLFCPMHTDDTNCIQAYLKICKEEFQRLGVTVTFDGYDHSQRKTSV